MKIFAIAIVESILTASYWWVVLTVSYGLFGGSSDPAGPPPDQSYAMLETVGTIAFGIITYALLSIMWQRVVRSRIR